VLDRRRYRLYSQSVTLDQNRSMIARMMEQTMVRTMTTMVAARVSARVGQVTWETSVATSLMNLNQRLLRHARTAETSEIAMPIVVAV
jgi:hypothetical protein